MNDLSIFLSIVACAGGVALLIGGAMVALLLRRRPDYGSVAALEAFDRRVVGWATAGRLPPDLADSVHALIAADRAQALGWAPPAAAQAAVPARAAATPPAAQPAMPAQPQMLSAAPPPAMPRPELSAAPIAPEPQPPAAKAAAGRPQLLSALLALATRRTLLFLGSFLLAVSAITLVIFNWASFPPLVQVGMLAAVTGGLWAGGAWMASRQDLETAGRNLQAVAGLLVPVVFFALTRPGLLDLAPRPAWLTVSLLCLPIYLLAAWRSGRGFYSVSAALAGASALLAGLGGVDTSWLAAPLALLFCAYLPAARRLRASAAPALAVGPFWVAHIGLPLALLAELALWMAGGAAGWPLASALGAGALFYGLATWADGRPAWVWPAALLLPAAVWAAMQAAGLDLRFWAPGMASLGLLYLGLTVALERRWLVFARPLAALAPLLGGLGLLLAVGDLAAARATLPLLLLGAVAVVALIEAGRLAWLGPRGAALGSLGMAAAALLLPAWLLALLDLSDLSTGARGLALAPLAGLYFAGARWWPGQLRPSYDRTLQAAGALLALAAGGASLLDEATWVPGAALLALIWAGQALIRRRSLWAIPALGSALLAGALALGRLPDAPASWWIWAAVGYSALYATGGGRLRRSPWGYWSLPAAGWAAVAGVLALLGDTAMIAFAGGAPLYASGALLALAGVLALSAALWRRPWAGYPAAALLIAAALLAAEAGFYSGWRPAPGDLAYIACALAGGLGLLGQGLRRRADPAYARPYELLGLALLSAAPLLAGADPAHQSLTWLAMAGLYGLATWRYRAHWLLAAACVALDLGLLHGAAWLLPAGPPAGASLILLAAVALQALAALWLRHSITSLLLGTQRLPGAPVYTAAAIGGAGALLIALGSDGHLAAVALGLALLLALVATFEAWAATTWAALGLLALGLGSLHRALGLGDLAGLGWGLAESLALYGAGWALAGRGEPRARLWQPALRAAPAGGGLLIATALAAGALDRGSYGFVGLGLGGLGLLLAAVARRERQPWLYSAALAAADLAALALAIWRFPALTTQQLAPIMLAAAWAQGLGALLARRKARPEGLPIYAAAGMSGALALGLAWGGDATLAWAGLAMALLAGLAAWGERSEPAAWGSVGLAGLAAWSLHGAIGLAPIWGAAWLVLELIGLVAAGWGLERLGGYWRRPSSLGPLALALAALVAVAALVAQGDLLALTFALASMGLLLATLAVRLRQLGYAYAAGAALVAAGLCQLADWDVREPQGYVLPAGIYLLALAEGLRRFQGQRRASQVIEAAAAMILLGVTLNQAIRSEAGPLPELLLCGEALLMTAYGALRRLRLPFVSGVAFFVAGVLWMVADTVQITNQWLIFGSVGILMIAAYVILERYQERLLRAGRAWMAELRGWG